MVLTTAFLIGIGLSMDAFAVSITNGISQKNSTLRHALITALSFGLFQGFMPFFGWLLGSTIADYIRVVDHWIAFALLGGIGINMIAEAIKEKNESESSSSSFSFKMLLFTSIATSIDALVIGVSFPLSGIITLTETLLSCTVIAATTFVVCTAGFYIGRTFGKLFKTGAQILGGCILIILGLKILIEHLFFS